MMPAQDSLIPRPFEVAVVRRELADTVTLELQPKDQGEEVSFEPGQFNMLYAFGAGDVPISISGDPGKTGRLVHTIRAVGATMVSSEGACAAYYQYRARSEST